MSSRCSKCMQPFGSIFNREDHCRKCGKFFCAKCAPRKSEVKGHKGPVRVCDPCFFVLNPTAQPLPPPSSQLQQQQQPAAQSPPLQQQQPQQPTSITAIPPEHLPKWLREQKGIAAPPINITTTGQPQAQAAQSAQAAQPSQASQAFAQPMAQPQQPQQPFNLADAPKWYREQMGMTAPQYQVLPPLQAQQLPPQGYQLPDDAPKWLREQRSQAQRTAPQRQPSGPQTGASPADEALQALHERVQHMREVIHNRIGADVPPAYPTQPQPPSQSQQQPPAPPAYEEDASPVYDFPSVPQSEEDGGAAANAQGSTAPPPTAEELERRLRASRTENVPSAEELEKRLQESRGPKLPAASDDELLARFAALTGRPIESLLGTQGRSLTQPPNSGGGGGGGGGVLPPDHVSEQEQIDALMAHVGDEVDIEDRHTPRAQDEEGVERVEGTPGAQQQQHPEEGAAEQQQEEGKAPSGGGDQQLSADAQRVLAEAATLIAASTPVQPHEEGAEEATDEEDEEAQMRALLERIRVEAELEERTGHVLGSPDTTAPTPTPGTKSTSTVPKSLEPSASLRPPPPSSSSSFPSTSAIPPYSAFGESPAQAEEEQPWCVLCNEDASVRCRECEGDLYCTACFRDAHRDADMRDHKGEKIDLNAFWLAQAPAVPKE